MNGKSLLASLLVSVTVVAIYHVVRSEGTLQSGASRHDEALEDLTLRVRALESARSEDPTLAGRADEPSGPTLEERLGELEARVREVAERTRPPEPGAPSPLIQAAEERARREVREREMAIRRQEIRRLDPNLAENDVSEAARLLSDFAQAVRALYEGKEHVDAAERAELRRRYDDLSRKLEAELSRCLGPELASRLAGRTSAADAGDHGSHPGREDD